MLSFLNMELDVLEPLLHIEARTGFLDPGEVAMADDLGFGIVEDKAVEKFLQGLLLGWCACVGRVAVGI